MTFELFGTNQVNEIVYLGSFVKESHALEALDQYQGIGYKNLKLANWKVR